LTAPYDRRVRDEVVLPPLPASVKRARRFVSDALSEIGIGETADDAALVVSELVTNAVVHAGTDITVRVMSQGRGARVEIVDGSPEMPGLRIPNAGARSGRGLLLVEHFTAQWGVERTSSGKVVWFDVRQED
jgi:anti-sigma regulatory factor (Ser/Thr protein kinase)